MEAVIREGTLRLLTSEASCDVILSCQGHRLMAHKLILSIASPMLRVSVYYTTRSTAFLIREAIKTEALKTCGAAFLTKSLSVLPLEWHNLSTPK
jgi:hypothetical protein